MKKLKNKLLVLVLFVLLCSCKKGNEIENILTNKNVYWQYKNNCGSKGIYFRFNENGKYDKYNRFINDGFVLFNDDGDLISSKRTWSVKNDSVFSWDGEDYKIESRSSKEIVLYYINEEKKECRITLNKIVDK